MQAADYFLTRTASKNQPSQNITSLFRFLIKTEVQLISTTVTGLGSLSPSTVELNALRKYRVGSTFFASNSVSPQSSLPNATLSFPIVKIWPTSCAASRSSREVTLALSIGLVNRHLPVTIRSIESEALTEGAATRTSNKKNCRILARRIKGKSRSNDICSSP
jgi:hypothetical protein